MADVAVLTAVSGADWEAQLVTALERAPGGLYVARRCVDVADLLATAAAGHGQVVFLSADLRRLDRDVLARLRESGVAVVGVVPPGAGRAVDRLRQFGVTDVVPADIDPAELAGVVDTALSAAATTNRLAGGSIDHGARPGRPESVAGTGRIVAVWGPTGAPGRTSVAVNLAAESARLGVATLLVDADTYGASVAQALGLLDEAPGLAAACRAANSGGLDAAGLAGHARQVAPAFAVLTGIARSDRWAEARAASLEVVWPQARHAAALTVVDTGFCLERDDQLSFDSAAPRRNAATLSALEHADVVIAVGAGDPVGLARLVRGLGDLDEAVPSAEVRVVVNRVRRSVTGARPDAQLTGALQRYAGRAVRAFIPDDQPAFDAALIGGQTLAEASPGSSARYAIAALAREISGAAAPEGRRGSLERLRAVRRA